MKSSSPSSFRFRTASAMIVKIFAALSVAFALSLGNQSIASAHEADGQETDEQHAKTDLADVPIDQTEAATEAKADEIQAATGVRPGDATPKVAGPNARSAFAAAAVADPGQSGSWSNVVDTDVVPIFQSVLPNGKVLMWDSVGTNATETYPNQTFTRALVWNPVTNTSKRVDVQGYNIFCAGFTSLINGNILVAGGNKNQALDGIVQTHIFNWQNETWSRGPDMASGRWYPAVTPLNNGDAAIFGGGPSTAEVYQYGSKSIRQLTGFTHYSDRIYPFVSTRPDGKVELLGPTNPMQTVKIAGTGSITRNDNRDNEYRGYGSFANYAIGKTLIAGGGTSTDAPSNTAVIVNTNGSGASATPTSSMNFQRRQFTTTILADGTVLANGGMSTANGQGLIDLNNPVKAAERWDPATGKWTVLASANRVREYHSASVLLPDGRVLTGGGGICGPCTEAGYLEKNVEYFTPPYLYKKDGSGQLAARPSISGNFSFVEFNTSFSITSPQAANIKKLGLVRVGAATHGIDQSQRYIALDYKVSGNTITAKAPVNGGVAPPGYYMMFATDANGVPSVAKTIRVLAGATPIATAIKNVSGKCLDVPQGSTVDGNDLWMHNCAASGNQNWTAPSDKSLQALGKCMEITGNSRAQGTTVQLSTCTGSTAQKWTRNVNDLSIRLTDQPSLCLAVVNGSTAVQARLEIRTCNATNAQKFTW